MEERESVSLPGVGEIRGRLGTSTMQLAGAAKFWHDKYRSAKRDGVIAGIALMATLEIAVVIAYYYLRSR